MRHALALVLALAAGAAVAEDLAGLWAWGSARRSAGVPFLRITPAPEGWKVETKHYMHAHFVGGVRALAATPTHLEFTYWYEPLGRWAQCSFEVAGDRMDGECDGEPGASQWGRVPAHLWRMREAPGARARAAVVRVGLERLDAPEAAVLAGGRLALVTDASGVDSRGRRDIDLLARDGRWKLATVFRTQGANVLPIEALRADALGAVDVLVYDMQDVGSRNAPSFGALERALRAAAGAKKPLVVLDRPNPLGADLQGDGSPIPLAHGLTAGELASFLNASIGARLVVVRAEGWRHAMRYEDTGLAWVPPSKDLASLEAVRQFPGFALFAATNVAVGLGTDLAFQQLSAPWLDAETLAKRLNALGMPGTQFLATARGVRVVAADSARAAVAALVEVRALHPDRFQITAPADFDRLAGGPRLREQLLAGEDLMHLMQDWRASQENFRRAVAPYRLYD